MSVETMARPKADKSDEKFEGMTRMADDVLEVARVLAPMRGVNMAKLMSDILRPVLNKMLDEEMRRRLGKK
jgi:hypothetical protein